MWFRPTNGSQTSPNSNSLALHRCLFFPPYQLLTFSSSLRLCDHNEWGKSHPATSQFMVVAERRRGAGDYVKACYGKMRGGQAVACMYGLCLDAAANPLGPSLCSASLPSTCSKKCIASSLLPQPFHFQKPPSSVPQSSNLRAHTLLWSSWQRRRRWISTCLEFIVVIAALFVLWLLLFFVF